MQLGLVECVVLDDPRFCQSTILLRSFSGQRVRLFVEGFLVDLLLSMVFAVVAVVQELLQSQVLQFLKLC